MRSRSLYVGALAVSLALAGCGDDGADDAPEDRAAEPTTSPSGAPSEVTLPFTPLTVELLDAGARPRQLLVQDFAAVEPWAGNLRFNIDAGPASATVEGLSQLDIESVDDQGTATAGYGLVGLDVTIGAGTTSAPDALDITGELVVQADRTVTSATVRAEATGSIPGIEGVAGAIDPRLPSLLLPFPSEAIGTGARWNIRGPLSMLGVDLELDAVARLVRRTGPRFDVAVRIDLNGVDRVGTTLSGFGMVTGAVDQLGPISGSIAVTGTVIPAGETRPQSVTLDLRIREQ